MHRVGREGLGTVVTRALALAAIAGMAGVTQSLVSPPIRLTLEAPAVVAGVAGPQGDAAAGDGLRVGPDDPVVETAPAVEAAAEVRIGLDRALALLEAGAQFIDARRRDDWLAGHVLGAVQMTPAEFRGGEPHALDALDMLDPTVTTVVYCVGGDCDESENLAILLQEQGFTDLRIMTASFADWEAAGHPVEVGDPLQDGGMP